MKKTNLLLYLFLFISGTIFAQTPAIEWTKSIVSPDAPGEFAGEFMDLWVDNSGNSYLMIYSELSLNLETGEKITVPDGQSGYVLIKYRPNGTVAWTRSIFTEQLNYDGKLCGDSQGNVYVGGSFLDSVNIDTGTKLKVSCTIGCSEIFVAKFDSNGKSLWIKGVQSNDTQQKKLGGLACDSQNNLYISGEYDGSTLVFEGGFKYENLPETRYFLAKLTPDWKPVWVQTLNNQGGEANNSLLCISSNDAIYTAGSYSSGTIQFNASTSLSLFGTDNFYIANYDTNGNLKWARNINSKDYLDILDLDADAKGNVYLCGDFSNTVNTNNTEILKGKTDYSSTVLRINASEANSITSIDYTNEDGYPITTCSVQPQGDYFAGGFFADNSIVVNGKNVNNSGCADLVLIQGNANSFKNAIGVGGTGCEGIANFNDGSAMDFDPGGNLYVAVNYLQGAKIGAFSYQQSGLLMVKASTGLVSTDAPESAMDLSIQPNPSDGFFQVRFPSPNPEGWLIVYDNQGSEVYRERVVSEIQSVELKLSNGIYWLQWLDGSRAGHQKLVIQR